MDESKFIFLKAGLKLIMEEKRLNEIYLIILSAITILMLLSLISYSGADLSFNSYPANIKIHNFIGKIGAYFAFFAFFIFGKTAFFLPVITGLWAFSRYLARGAHNIYVKIITTFILLISFSTILSLFFDKNLHVKFSWGGITGLTASALLFKYFSKAGSYIIVTTLAFLSVLVATEFLILTPILRFFKSIPAFFNKMTSMKTTPRTIEIRTESRLQRESVEAKIRERTPGFSEQSSQEAKPRLRIKKYEPSPMKTTVKIKPAVRPQPAGGFCLPPLNLLAVAPAEKRKIEDNFQAASLTLEGTLRDFGIETKVVSVNQGPVITRYELQPAAGVKVNRIVNLNDDIALAMKAHSVRIVAPIPGKDRVGIEVPNSKSTLVYVRDLLESSDFQETESKLTLAIGKDIAGEAIITDLGDMPHLLIAGTTGSGKTVCMNSLIISLLYKATPEELKFVMVDPKMVELAPFNGLPHLLCPVITDAKKASGALNWIVGEMERRYKILAEIGVRNIDLYNKKMRNESGEIMSYLVVIIDELADLMAVSSQDIESAITRLAQLSRAVGIHMILATQRPSVDVITGVIKANFPARISFKVASKVDSRTVLDMNGADKLLGKGDMLFVKPGDAKPIRAQASLVSDAEIENVVNFLKEQRQAHYNDEIVREQEKKIGVGNFERDELFDEAVKLVIETGQASVSMLQRRLRLGYTRAARLIDAMEAEGIIGSFCGSKPREILIDSYQGQQLQSEEKEEIEN
ncbi:MAG: DNA translocase FtsK [Candidatus Omnitrophota bacterium]